MSALAAPAPARDPIPTPQPRREARVDWAQVARLLAAGYAAAEVAAIVGCTRQHIWRILRRSPRLQARVGAARAERDAEASARLADMNMAALDVIAEALHRGDLRAAMWVVTRNRIGAVHYPGIRDPAGRRDGAAPAAADGADEDVDAPLEVEPDALAGAAAAPAGADPDRDDPMMAAIAEALERAPGDTNGLPVASEPVDPAGSQRRPSPQAPPPAMPLHAAKHLLSRKAVDKRLFRP